MKLPRPVLASASAAIAAAFTHRELEKLFDLLDAKAPTAITWSNKEDRVKAYLMTAELGGSALPLLGGLLHELLDVETPRVAAFNNGEVAWAKHVEVMLTMMEKAGLRYQDGKVLHAGAAAPPPSAQALRDALRGGDYSSVEKEVGKALAAVEIEPREAVRAACAMLESLFKHYIEDTPDLAMPAKKDLGSLWSIIRKQFNLHAAALEDQDLQKIVTGLGSIVDGIGALRTHASTAHGQGRKNYNIAPRHARLAVNSSHALALYILEAWTQREANRKP